MGHVKQVYINISVGTVKIRDLGPPERVGSFHHVTGDGSWVIRKQRDGEVSPSTFFLETEDRVVGVREDGSEVLYP